MSELLPCPFCGGKARWRYQKPIGWVMCKECGASSAALSDKYEEADCQQEAITAWNRRTEPVKHGEWKTWEEQFPDRTTRKKNNLGVFCSACQLHADNMTSYCPNCGAKMEDKPCG